MSVDIVEQRGTEEATGRVRGRPFWEKKRGILWLDGRIVKQFKHPAGVQQRILSEFEDLGWPDVIDDPLPLEHVDPKERLRDAIRRLNYDQKEATIIFEGNGTGTAICWRLP